MPGQSGELAHPSSGPALAMEVGGGGVGCVAGDYVMRGRCQAGLQGCLSWRWDAGGQPWSLRLACGPLTVLVAPCPELGHSPGALRAALSF